MADSGFVIVITSHGSEEWDGGGDSVITAGLLTLWPDLCKLGMIFSKSIPFKDIDARVEKARYIIQAGTPSWLTVNNRVFWKAAIKHRKHIAMLGIGLAVPYASEMWYGAE